MRLAAEACLGEEAGAGWLAGWLAGCACLLAGWLVAVPSQAEDSSGRVRQLAKEGAVSRPLRGDKQAAGSPALLGPAWAAASLAEVDGWLLAPSLPCDDACRLLLGCCCLLHVGSPAGCLQKWGPWLPEQARVWVCHGSKEREAA